MRHNTNLRKCLLMTQIGVLLLPLAYGEAQAQTVTVNGNAWTNTGPATPPPGYTGTVDECNDNESNGSKITVTCKKTVNGVTTTIGPETMNSIYSCTYIHSQIASGIGLPVTMGDGLGDKCNLTSMINSDVFQTMGPVSK